MAHQDQKNNTNTHDGRNDAWLLGHDASWTGHCTAQQSTLPSRHNSSWTQRCITARGRPEAYLLHSSTQPSNCTSLSRYYSPRTSGQSAAHPAVSQSPRVTGPTQPHGPHYTLIAHEIINLILKWWQGRKRKKKKKKKNNTNKVTKPHIVGNTENRI